MPRPRVRVDARITYNRLPDFVRELQPEADEATHEEAIAIRDEAAAHSRVDTGAMKAGWYAVTPIEDGYPAAKGAADARRPGSATTPRNIRQSKHDATIGNVVEYTPHHEYGTVNMSAQAMLTPAAENSKRRYPVGVAVRVRDLAGRLSH